MSTVQTEPAGVAARRVLERLRESAATRGAPTGLADLDNLTGGLLPGALWALTGVPGAGKSVLALGFARVVASTAGLPVLVVTRREGINDLAERVLAAEAKVGLFRLQQGQPNPEDWVRLEATCARLKDCGLHLAHADEPAEAVGRLAPDLAPRLVIVDDVAAGSTRVAQLSELRGLAARLRCAVLAVLTPEPRLAAGPAEDEAALVADVVARLQDHSSDRERAGETDLVVTHHRRGPVSTLMLHNQMPWGRFVPPP